MTTIAELNATVDRFSRRVDTIIAENAARDAEYKAAREQLDAQLKAEAATRDAEFKAVMESERKKTDAAIRKSIGHFDSQWGRFVEALCANQVVRLLNSRGIEVHHTSPRVRRHLPTGGYYEIDILVVNGDTIVAFEVKTTLRPEDVDNVITKLGCIREMFSEYRNYRVLGGVAYLREDSFAVQNAQQQGLFTILATGNGATITNEEAFAPKEW